MTFRYTYFPEINCLCTVGTGRVSLEAFLDYHRSIKIDNPPSTLRILSDYRQLDPSDLQASDVDEMKMSALRRVEGKYEKVREAAVVSDFLSWGLSRQYDGMHYTETYELNVFTDIDEAKVWLGLDPEADLAVDG